MRPYGVWARDRAVQLPSGARRRPGGRRTRRRQHVRHQAVRDRLAVRTPDVRRVRRRRRAARSRQPRDRSRRPGGRRARSATTGLGGLTFTGSSARRDVDHPVVLDVAPTPAICEMGGKNPVIVAASADLELGGRGHGPVGVRFRRPEVLGRVAGVRRRVARRRVLRPSGRPRRGDPRASDRSSRGGFLSPVVDAAARRALRARSSPTPGSPARCCAGGDAARPTAISAAATSSRPPSCACPTTR